MNINELALRMRAAAKNAADNFHPNMLVQTRDIITLVEALEKAQQKADVYNMIREDCNLRGKGIGLANFVDWQAKRIAELEFIRTSADKVQREFADELGCAGDNESILQAINDLKQQAKSRTVKIPYLPDDCDRTEAHYKYQAALRAAGIKVEAE